MKGGQNVLPIKDQVIDFFMTYPNYTSTELSEIFKISAFTACKYMSIAIDKTKARRKMELIIESGNEVNPESEIEHINLSY